MHLGWAVQVYNAAEALPNLINPFWMLPLVGILGLKARDIVGFSFLQLIVHVPVVLFLLWYFARTLAFVPPMLPVDPVRHCGPGTIRWRSRPTTPLLRSRFE